MEITKDMHIKIFMERNNLEMKADRLQKENEELTKLLKRIYQWIIGKGKDDNEIIEDLIEKQLKDK